MTASGANSLQKGTNRVSVTVTAENGAVKVYYLTVMCGKDKEDIIVSVNGRNYILVTENLPDPPENFTEITLVVGEEDVPGYESPNGKLSIVCLEDEDGGKGWFIYNKDNDTYTELFTAPDAKILVVDDNEINLVVTQNLLKDTMMNIETASSGKEITGLIIRRRFSEYDRN